MKGYTLLAHDAVQDWTAEDGGLTYAANDVIAFGAWLDCLVEQAARAKTPATLQEVLVSWEAAYDDASDTEFSLLSAVREEIDSHARRVCESISDPVERAGTYWLLLRRSYRDHEGDVIIPLPLKRGWGKTDILTWAASRAVQEELADDPEDVVAGLRKTLTAAAEKARNSKRADTRRKWKRRLESLQVVGHFVPRLVVES